MMPDRPKALDLFCGAGGAAMGLHRAGFDVVGVDINPQPRYPFEFFQADVMRLNLRALELDLDRTEFDLVWASPPCQRYSDLAHRNKNGGDWPDLIEGVREKLVDFGVNFVIENVERSPLRSPVMLCGTMFPGLRVLRHRLFEATFPIDTPPHGLWHPRVHTFDRRKSHYGKTDDMVDFVQVTGGGNCTIAAARDAMGIDWMTKAEINEAIPPAYSELIGRAAMAHITLQ